MTKIGTTYELSVVREIMKRSIMLAILIGFVVFTTLIALVGGSIAHSYLYNKIWIASGNDTPECMTPNPNVFTCAHTDPEYYHGFYWSNHITQFSILIAGIILGIKLCMKKTDKITKKPFIIMVCIIVLVIIMVFAIGYFRAQSYYEGAYDFVMFDCFDERGRGDLHAKIIYQNDTHVIDNKNCQWKLRK